MSRKRSKRPQESRHSHLLRVQTQLLATGRVEVDPHYTRQAIEKLDELYQAAGRDDYDPNWEDDHKVAYFLFQIFDEILSKYEPQSNIDDIDPAPGVPHIREVPVRDVVDIANMTPARSVN